MKLLKTHYALLILLSLTFLAYAAILNNQFVWDDFEFIVQWETPRNLQNFPEFLKGVTPPGHEGVYRPIRTILYSIAIHIFGIENPFPYHLQGLLLHLGITTVIYFIVKKLSNNPLLSLLTAIIFGLHPIHTENIAFATANFDLYGILFMFASYLLYLYSERGKKRIQLVCALVFAFLAIFTNELTLPLIVFIFITDFLLTSKSTVKKTLPIYGLFLLPTILYFFIRFILVDIPTRTGFLVDSFFFTMLTMTKVFLRYIILLILPLDLNVIPTIAPGITSLEAEESAVFSQSVFEAQSIITILIIVGLIASIVFLYKSHKIASFALLWIVVAMLPFSNIIPVGILFSERYLYIASFGVCLFAAYWFVYVVEHKNIPTVIKNVTLGLLIILLSFYFIRTVLRNNDWQNSVVLWEQTISQSPNNADMYNNAGIAYSQAGENERAIEKFRKAIEIHPNDARYHANMALSLWNSGQFYEALSAWEEANRIDPNNETYANNLAKGYLALEQEEAAIKTLTSTEFNEYAYQAYTMLGEAYFKVGAYDKSEESFRKSIKLNSTYAEAYGGLASIYMVKKDTEVAKDLLIKTIRLNPEFAPAYHNLALIYLSRQEIEQAHAMVNQALSLQPHFPEAQQLKENIERFLETRENRATE